MFESGPESFFEFRILRYEFPDEETGPTEDNPAEEFEEARWLIVQASFGTTDGKWCVTGPYITTTEIDRFADWLDSICQGRSMANGSHFYFIERDMEWTYDDCTSILTLHIYRDFRPPFNTEGESMKIEFPIGEMDLVSIVASLRQFSLIFPGCPSAK